MNQLRVLRAQRGMTLRELAKASGVSKDGISEIERGRRKPRTFTLGKLADGLGMERIEFMARMGLEPHVPEPHRKEQAPVLGEGGRFTAVYERDGDWWLGYVEELPGANAQERTLDEARESLREAVEDVLEANRELTRMEFEGRDVVREPIGA